MKKNRLFTSQNDKNIIRSEKTLVFTSKEPTFPAITE